MRNYASRQIYLNPMANADVKLEIDRLNELFQTGYRKWTFPILFPQTEAQWINWSTDLTKNPPLRQ
jgi:hypothetical protein